MKDEIKATQICKDYHSRYCFNECKCFGNCLDQEIGDSLPDDMAICSTCGRILPEKVMHGTNTGRHTQLQCPKCFLKGMNASGKFAFRRAPKREE